MQLLGCCKRHVGGSRVVTRGGATRGAEMPKVSKDSATGGGEFGPVTDRSAQVDGYTVNFTSFTADVDATPLMKGLPDDRCQCPHWGYVLSGKMTFRYADAEEVFEAGRCLLYVARPCSIGRSRD
jgi:hypothetical protein